MRAVTVSVVVMLFFFAAINRGEGNANQRNFTRSWHLWDLLDLVATLREGESWTDRKNQPDLLKDPHFLYDTFYKDEDQSRSSGGLVKRMLDFIQTEYQVRKIKENANPLEETWKDPKSSKPSPDLVGSIEREKRQISTTGVQTQQTTAVKPYSPYLGAIIWVFPVLSFTIPFGAYFRLFGFDML